MSIKIFLVVGTLLNFSPVLEKNFEKSGRKKKVVNDAVYSLSIHTLKKLDEVFFSAAASSITSSFQKLLLHLPLIYLSVVQGKLKGNFNAIL